MTDDTLSFLLAEQTTDWNPLIFTVFYQRLDMLQYFTA
jgi:hypothetical protein